MKNKNVLIGIGLVLVGVLMIPYAAMQITVAVTGKKFSNSWVRMKQADPTVRMKQADPIGRMKQADPIGRMKQADPIVRMKQADPIVRMKQADPIGLLNPFADDEQFVSAAFVDVESWWSEWGFWNDYSVKDAFVAKYVALDVDAAQLAYLDGLTADTRSGVGFNSALAGVDGCLTEKLQAHHFLQKAAEVIRTDATSDGVSALEDLSDEAFVKYDAFSRAGMTALQRFVQCRAEQ